jgi:hypothetical protein
MKKLTFFYYLAAVALLGFSVSCEKDDEEPVKTFEVTVQLVYPDGFEPAASVTVSLKNNITGAVVANTTDVNGATAFTVLAGLYEATASDVRSDDYFRYFINGSNSNIAVTDTWVNGTSVSVPLTLRTEAQPAAGDVSPYGKLIIKELYIGGCQKNDASGSFQRDPYIIIYNNSNQPAVFNNMAFGAAFPHNGHAPNYFFNNGALDYASQDWLPSAYGAWQVTNNDTIAPGEQRVIAMNAAIDHTPTYSNSINFANPAYYVAYDPASGYTNQTYHPAPSEVIPAAHYLKAYRLSGVSANAWTFSINSPAFFIFTPAGEVSLDDFAAAPENLVLHGTTPSQVAIKVPRTWVIDAIEVFQHDKLAESRRRLTDDIDVGYILFTNSYGHTLYRNVDKAATEAIIANQGKLVYEYSFGWEESTDPSGIDAEASIKNGARIVYKETNNTANDFHQRSRASLRVND